MKKTFLIIALSFASIVFCQTNRIEDKLVGYWKPEVRSTHLIFLKDATKGLRALEFSMDDGQQLTVTSLKIYKDIVVTKTIFEDTGWTLESKYRLINYNTLECVMTGDANTTIIYKRVK